MQLSPYHQRHVLCLTRLCGCWDLSRLYSHTHLHLAFLALPITSPTVLGDINRPPWLTPFLRAVRKTIAPSGILTQFKKQKAASRQQPSISIVPRMPNVTYPSTACLSSRSLQAMSPRTSISVQGSDPQVLLRSAKCAICMVHRPSKVAGTD